MILSNSIVFSSEYYHTINLNPFILYVLGIFHGARNVQLLDEKIFASYLPTVVSLYLQNKEKLSEHPPSVLIRGSLNRFPDFFRMYTFIDSTHMKL